MNWKPVIKFFRAVDSLVSSSVFETTDWLRRSWLAYSAFLLRFRITGLKRVVVDLADDMATFGMVIAVGIIALALPTLKETDDI